MSLSDPLAALLNRLQRNPREADLESAAERYADEATAEGDRAAIRAVASTTRKLMFGLEAWGHGLSPADPERYLRLRLAILSMSDGWPDSRDAFLAAKDLLRLADAHGERCQSLLKRLVAVSTPLVQHLFSSPTLNMTLWR